MKLSPAAEKIIKKVEALDRATLLTDNEVFLANGDPEYLKLAVEGYRAMANLLPSWATPKKTFLEVAERLEKLLKEKQIRR